MALKRINKVSAAGGVAAGGCWKGPSSPASLLLRGAQFLAAAARPRRGCG